MIAFYRTHPGDTGYPLFSMPFARSLAAASAPFLVLGVMVMLPVVVRMWRRQRVALVLLLSRWPSMSLSPPPRPGRLPRAFIFALPSDIC